MEAAVKGNHSLPVMLSKQTRREDARAALLMAYFLVEHNLPLVLADHISKLNLAQYPDSVVTSHVKCTRTKATACFSGRVSQTSSKFNANLQVFYYNG